MLPQLLHLHPRISNLQQAGNQWLQMVRASAPWECQRIDRDHLQNHSMGEGRPLNLLDLIFTAMALLDQMEDLK